MNTVFYISAAVAVLATLLAVTRLNAVHALLYLIVSLLASAVVLFDLGAPFVAALEVIIYAGAIMVLFTFVVMLLNAGREERTLGSRAARAIGFPAVVAILAVIATVILHAQGLGVAKLSDGITSTEELSAVLFTKLLLPFEVTSVLILIAILGAVVLARHSEGNADSQGSAERTGEE